MYLDYTTSTNTMIGSVDNHLIMLYGHVNERYEQYLSRIQKATNQSYMKLNKLIPRACSIVKKNYKECLNPTDEKVRHVIRDQIRFNCEGQLFIVDVTILVSGSTVTFRNKHRKHVHKQYEEIYKTGKMYAGDKILALETLATTIRLEDEKLENFGRQPSIGDFKFANKIFNVSKEEFLYMIEPIWNDRQTKVSRKATKLIEQMN